MDDKTVIDRIVNILNSEAQNLVKGNITSPKPGSLCQVTTDYGVKEAYNINCTYPGDAYVVWDKEEEKYYCFTDKPSEVINSRQLSYRKYKKNIISKKTKGFVLYMDSNYFVTSRYTDLFNNSMEFWHSACLKLNPKYKTIYFLNSFFDLPCTVSAMYSNNDIKNYFVNTLKKKFVSISHTQLDVIDDICWMPFFASYSEVDFADNLYTKFNSNAINTVKDIARKYGIILATEWWDSEIAHTLTEDDGVAPTTVPGSLIMFYINNFYNPYNINQISSSSIHIWQRYFTNKDVPKEVFGELTGVLDVNIVPKQNVLLYSMLATRITRANVDFSSKQPAVISWKL